MTINTPLLIKALLLLHASSCGCSLHLYGCFSLCHPFTLKAVFQCLPSLATTHSLKWGARTAGIREHKLCVPLGFQEGKPGGNWMKTQDANIFKVFSLDPSVCLKGNTTLSHCAGLAQMAGEIWQQDSIRGLALSLFSPQGFLSLAITFFCCTWCSSIRSFLYFSKN